MTGFTAHSYSNISDGNMPTGRLSDLTRPSHYHTMASFGPQGVAQVARKSVRQTTFRGEVMKDPEDVPRNTIRYKIKSIMDSGSMDGFMAFIIVFNIVMLIKETDDFAVCVRDNLPQEVCEKVWMEVTNYCLLGLYTLETLLRLYAHHLKYFHCTANLVDFSNVCLGWMDVVLARFASDVLPSTQMLRIIRLVRLVRAVRLLATSPELGSLLRGFASAIKAMFWGFVMISLQLVVLAIVSVEVLPPMMQDIEIPEICKDGFESTFSASVSLFQAMVAGDSWGTCAIPLIRQYPITLIFFCGAFLLIELGWTNLILSVIVGRAVRASEQDMIERRKIEQETYHSLQQQLKEILRAVDVDGDGMVSLNELMEGFDKNDKLKIVLQALHIDKQDLPALMDLMDVDKSGDLSYEEFTDIALKADSPTSNLHLFLVAHHLLELTKVMQQRLLQQGKTLDEIRSTRISGFPRDSEQSMYYSRGSEQSNSDRNSMGNCERNTTGNCERNSERTSETYGPCVSTTCDFDVQTTAATKKTVAFRDPSFKRPSEEKDDPNPSKAGELPLPAKEFFSVPSEHLSPLDTVMTRAIAAVQPPCSGSVFHDGRDPASLREELSSFTARLEQRLNEPEFNMMNMLTNKLPIGVGKAAACDGSLDNRSARMVYHNDNARFYQMTPEPPLSHTAHELLARPVLTEQGPPLKVSARSHAKTPCCHPTCGTENEKDGAVKMMR